MEVSSDQCRVIRKNGPVGLGFSGVALAGVSGFPGLGGFYRGDAEAGEVRRAGGSGFLGFFPNAFGGLNSGVRALGEGFEFLS